MTVNCLFCKIVSREIAAQIVFEDDKIIAINDINPAAPVHILIIPKEHIASLAEISEQHNDLLGHIQLTAARLAKDLKISEQGYRLVNNCGIWGGQTVLHLHYHLLGGRELSWPPG
ncbi:MAG: histidine triad nucleotide-binding protein [Syntrophomonadaceae bacterium]|nr:histidine triad nucleotide-binding protein [Syntrophomonadaceae bacterium]MDD3022777.1 histidine triad nucleotide-binding protein [Syntrophomonadaceae bacterium]